MVERKYDRDHPDADLFNEKTLGDYLARKAPWPCVVVGGKTPEKKENGNQRSDQTN